MTPDEIQIKHDLGNRLTVHTSRSSNERMEIIAILDPTGSGQGEVNGTIELTFRDPSLPAISIPVLAMVKP